jgi:hypothetical protein
VRRGQLRQSRTSCGNQVDGRRLAFTFLDGGNSWTPDVRAGHHTSRDCHEASIPVLSATGAD